MSLRHHKQFSNTSAWCVPSVNWIALHEKHKYQLWYCYDRIILENTGRVITAPHYVLYCINLIVFIRKWCHRHIQLTTLLISEMMLRSKLLHWRHNGRDGVSNHQPHDKAPRHWPSNAENIFIWCHVVRNWLAPGGSYMSKFQNKLGQIEKNIQRDTLTLYIIAPNLHNSSSLACKMMFHMTCSCVT